MKYKILLFVYFSILSTKLWAVHYEYITFDKEILRIKNANFYVEQVIDVRESQMYIGCAPRNGRAEVVRTLPKPLATDLQRLWNQSCPAAEGVTPITIKINHLFVYEKLTNGRVGSVELNRSFITHNDQHQYTELLNAATNHLSKGHDASRDQRNILNAVEQCVEQYQRRTNINQLNNTPLTTEQLNSNSVLLTKYKCLSDTDFAAGLYPNFIDFRDNLPISNPNYTIDYRTDFKDNSTFAYLMQKNSNKKIEDVWGFSDGKNVFINLGNRYVPMKKENNNFVFFNKVYLPNNDDIMVAGILFGLVGTLVATAVDANNTSTVKFQLDLVSGTPLNISDNKPKQIQSSFLLYCSKYSNTDEPFDVYLDDVKLCALQSGNYFVSTVGFKNQPSNLCLKYKDREVCKVLEPNPFERIVYLCRFGSKDKLVMDKLNIQMQKSVMTDIKEGRIKKTCE